MMKKDVLFIFAFIFFTCKASFLLYGEKIPPKIGIVVSAFNRPEYLSQTLQELQDKSFGPNMSVELVLIDDASEEEAEKLIDAFHLRDILTFRVRMPKNAGIAPVLLLGWNLLASRGCTFLCNLDSDVLLKQHWLKSLFDTYHAAKDTLKTDALVVSGFNAKAHPIQVEHASFFVKGTMGGINLFFPTFMYHTYVAETLQEGNLWDWALIARLRDHGCPMVCTKPSVVQHIGIQGLHSTDEHYDYAEDF